MPRESEDILGSACQWIQRDLHFAGVLFILRLLEQQLVSLGELHLRAIRIIPERYERLVLGA